MEERSEFALLMTFVVGSKFWPTCRAATLNGLIVWSFELNKLRNRGLLVIEWSERSIIRVDGEEINRLLYLFEEQREW